jgi:hypothetical protein
VKPLVICTYALLRPVCDLIPQDESRNFMLQAKMVINAQGDYVYDETLFFNTEPLINVDIAKAEFETSKTVYQVIPHREIQIYQMMAISHAVQTKRQTGSVSAFAIRQAVQDGDSNTQLKRW